MAIPSGGSRSVSGLLERVPFGQVIVAIDPGKAVNRVWVTVADGLVGEPVSVSTSRAGIERLGVLLSGRDAPGLRAMISISPRSSSDAFEDGLRTPPRMGSPSPAPKATGVTAAASKREQENGEAGSAGSLEPSEHVVRPVGCTTEPAQRWHSHAGGCHPFRRSSHGTLGRAVTPRRA